MEIVTAKIIESIVVIILFFLIRITSHKLINRTIIDKIIQKSRSQLIKKTINFMLFLIMVIVLTIIWGVKHSDLALFIGSILTVIGVAMFAQWSLLSNITSSIILFFNHSVKIGDRIAIMETKDYEIRGQVMNIGLFFVNLEIIDTKEEISLPNNIFIQKTIKKLNENSPPFPNLVVINNESENEDKDNEMKS